MTFPRNPHIGEGVMPVSDEPLWKRLERLSAQEAKVTVCKFFHVDLVLTDDQEAAFREFYSEVAP